MKLSKLLLKVFFLLGLHQMFTGNYFYSQVNISFIKHLSDFNLKKAVSDYFPYRNQLKYAFLLSVCMISQTVSMHHKICLVLTPEYMRAQKNLLGKLRFFFFLEFYMR